MGALWTRIRAALDDRRFIIGVHAAMRLRQRRIPNWQAISASLDGTLLAE